MWNCERCVIIAIIRQGSDHGWLQPARSSLQVQLQTRPHKLHVLLHVSFRETTHAHPLQATTRNVIDILDNLGNGMFQDEV